MSKRKASKAAAGESKAKRGAAAAASSSTSASAASPFAADSEAQIAAVNQALQRARHSAALAVLLQNRTAKCHVELMTSLAHEFAEDAKRPQPLIDLNFKLAGGGTLLTQLIESLVEHTLAPSGGTDAVSKQKRHACSIFHAQLSHVLSLVRACDASLLLSKDGESALSLLCKLVVPAGNSLWSYLLAEALLQAGAAVDAREKGGWTPLHRWAWSATASACGPLLFLRHGANIDATDFDGDAMLHFLVINARTKEKMLPALRELADSGYLALADFTLLNKAGQTALQMAQKLADKRPHDDAAAELLHILHAQSTMWSERIRPVTLSLLSHSYLLPDLAELVLAYVDGGERPSDKQAAAAAAMEVDEAAGSGSSAAAAAAVAPAHA